MNEWSEYTLADWMRVAKEAEVTADRRKKMLAKCSVWLAECPYCKVVPEVEGMYDERLVVIHTDDCELAKELEDD